MTTSHLAAQDSSRTTELARSASYQHIPQLNPPTDENTSIKRNLSEVNLSHPSTARQSQPSREDVETGKNILRQSSLRSQRNHTHKKTSSPGNSISLAPNGSISNGDAFSSNITSSLSRPKKSNLKPSSFSGLTLRPWKSSRSPSPSQGSEQANTPTKVPEEKPVVESGRAANMSGQVATDTMVTHHFESNVPAVLSKRNRRPASTIAPKPKPVAETAGKIPRTPSLQSLRRRPSLERIAASVGLKKDVPPLPQTKIPSSNLLKPDGQKKKDELWHVFRGLDADYQKYARSSNPLRVSGLHANNSDRFHSKSTSLKANVVRSSLLPCLARYSSHPSNQHLRPEDLDRRTNILNKWWTGLLELLNGRNSQSVTGVDRPAYLEAIISIMARPEWRISRSSQSSSSTPTATPKGHLPARSHTSLESTGSDFLAESIHHNVRNIFNQNLLSQMAYAIDRMSVRHTPSSLVAFCGKTCAYAFFFCRDVADVLVRLWNIPAGTLRRVLNTFDAEYNPAIKHARSEEISSHFPSAVRSLSLSAHSSLIRYLRRNVPIPFAASNINWFGPWVPRWAGRDTDLFSVFVKQFYILATEFLPSAIDPTKRAYIPGFIPIQAQILTIFHNTLSKHNRLQPTDALHNTTSATFDDLIDGADASATALPIRPPNSVLLMSECRLILAVRDFLADDAISPATKQLYVESFCKILHLGTRTTSLFDHNSCFSLCDFVEELISIIPPYCRATDQTDLLHWDFWLDVINQMLKSNNALTEVRTIAFIFAVWNEIGHYSQIKERLCLDLLLDEKVFKQYFTHWSPMVRGYYQRLLCWRVARHDGDQFSLDTRIYQTLSERLGEVWTCFTAHQAAAEKGLVVPLSTSPCTPAPGRRIIIIRNDYYMPSPNMFVCLDNIAPPSLSTRPSLDIELGTVKTSHRKSGGNPESSPPQIKKTWKMLRTMFKNPANPKPGEVTPPGSSSAEDGNTSFAVDVPNGTHGSKARSAGHENGGKSEVTPDASRQLYTFRFCLEWVDRLKWPNRNRPLYPPSLPAPARLYLHSLQKNPINHSDSSLGSMSNSLSDTGSENGSELDSVEELLVSSLLDSTMQVGPLESNTTSSKSETNPLPTVKHSSTNTYVGRALAEWAMIVSECDNFFERRRNEGIPNDRMVEVPTLGVDSFRK
ncbi:hypothetical protein FQN57_007297 [Myotisia sp. PD_48]|nr:hypothetical protein FQN57_007297 [Myotisia sp. PD_48]